MHGPLNVKFCKLEHPRRRYCSTHVMELQEQILTNRSQTWITSWILTYSEIFQVMMKRGGEWVMLLILLLHLQAVGCSTDVSLFTSTVNTEAVHFSKISVTQFAATRRLNL